PPALPAIAAVGHDILGARWYITRPAASARKRTRRAMDFGLSEEQRLLQETIRGFAAAECPLSQLRPLFEAGQGHDPALWKGLVEIGVAGLALPDEHGGSALDVLDLALAAEVIGESALPVPFLGHALAGLAIAWGGSPAQRAEWLPKLATGDALATVAFGEPADRWQPDEWQA